MQKDELTRLNSHTESKQNGPRQSLQIRDLRFRPTTIFYPSFNCLFGSRSDDGYVSWRVSVSHDQKVRISGLLDYLAKSWSITSLYHPEILVTQTFAKLGQ